MKRNALVMALVGLVVVMAGCGGGNPMAGTWKLQMSEEAKKKAPGGMVPDISMEFKGDGSFEGTVAIMGKSTKATGTYKLDGNTLTMTTTEVDGKKDPSSKPETITLADDKKSFELPNSGGMAKMVKQ